MFFSFAIVNYVAVFLYYSRYLGVEDEEEIGSSRAELGQEGFFTSFALFMVSPKFLMELTNFTGFMDSLL